jgi:hypothetical protein
MTPQTPLDAVCYACVKDDPSLIGHHVHIKRLQWRHPERSEGSLSQAN